MKILILCLLLTSCTLPSRSKDCGYRVNNLGENVYWHSIPIELWIHKDFPKDLIPALEAATETWNVELKEPLFIVKGFDKGPLQPRIDGRNIVYYGKVSEDKNATTDLYFRGDGMIDTDIVLSEALLPGMDPQGVLTHELGHVLGLEHKEDEKSIMYFSRAPYEIRRKLTNGDKQSLWCQYL